MTDDRPCAPCPFSRQPTDDRPCAACPSMEPYCHMCNMHCFSSIRHPIPRNEPDLRTKLLGQRGDEVIIKINFCCRKVIAWRAPFSGVCAQGSGGVRGGSIFAGKFLMDDPHGGDRSRRSAFPFLPRLPIPRSSHRRRHPKYGVPGIPAGMLSPEPWCPRNPHTARLWHGSDAESQDPRPAVNRLRTESRSRMRGGDGPPRTRSHPRL
jgi:hypothetical protein